VLTCKSLFGLGYRGERLIEPFIFFIARWLRVASTKMRLVGAAIFFNLEKKADLARPSNCRDIPFEAVGTAFFAKAKRGTRFIYLVLGMVTIQQIGTIGSQALRGFFSAYKEKNPTGAVHRLDVGRGSLFDKEKTLKI
jgi:hypothetical protein